MARAGLPKARPWCHGNRGQPLHTRAAIRSALRRILQKNRRAFSALKEREQRKRMAMLLVVRNEQSNRIAPVHECFAHVGEAEEIREALARSERLQDLFDLAVEHFARGIELRLRQLAEREKTQPQRPRDGSTAVASSDLVAHALAGAFIGFLNSWLRNGRPLSAKAVDTMFHRFAWAGITGAGATKEVNTF